MTKKMLLNKLHKKCYWKGTKNVAKIATKNVAK